jgi:hypothetical protein
VDHCPGWGADFAVNILSKLKNPRATRPSSQVYMMIPPSMKLWKPLRGNYDSDELVKGPEVFKRIRWGSRIKWFLFSWYLIGL